MTDERKHPIFHTLGKPILSQTNVGRIISNDPVDPESEDDIPDYQSNDSPVKSDISFWDRISELGWRDRSEGMSDDEAKRMKKRFSSDELKTYKPVYAVLLEQLMQQLRDCSIVSEQELRALASHCIARGSQFYHAILDDPYFAAYLVESRDYVSFDAFA